MKHKPLQLLGVLTIILLFSTPAVSAWCFIGIGNTCGDRATEQHGFLGDWFNNDEPQEENNDVSIFGWRPFKESPFEKSDNDFSNIGEGETADVKTDDGKVFSIRKVDTYDEVIGETEALFYDVDVTNIDLRCPACVVIDGKRTFTAGFDYLVDISLINTGNTPSQDVQMEITVETLDKVEHYNFNAQALILSPGEYILEGIRFDKFGVEFNRVKDLYVYKGSGDQKFPLTVTVQLSQSNGVSSPFIKQIKKVKRTCTGTGEDFSCKTDETFETIELCPDGTSYAGTYGCDLKDPADQDQLQKMFLLQKLTADLNSKANVGVLG